LTARAYFLTVNKGRRSTRGLIEADDKVAIGAFADLYYSSTGFAEFY
jgi:hypothetical protein